MVRPRDEIVRLRDGPVRYTGQVSDSIAQVPKSAAELRSIIKWIKPGKNKTCFGTEINVTFEAPAGEKIENDHPFRRVSEILSQRTFMIASVPCGLCHTISQTFPNLECPCLIPCEYPNLPNSCLLCELQDRFCRPKILVDEKAPAKRTHSKINPAEATASHSSLATRALHHSNLDPFEAMIELVKGDQRRRELVQLSQTEPWIMGFLVSESVGWESVCLSC